MKSLLFAVFLGSTVTMILADSHSMACSEVKGKWKCREMKDPYGNSAFSSSSAVSGPGGDSSTYEGVGTGSKDGFVWDHSGTGIFSDLNPGGVVNFPGLNPGGIGNFPGLNPSGGIGTFPGIIPSGGAGAFAGVSPWNPPGGAGAFAGVRPWSPPAGAGIFSAVNPSDDGDTYSSLNPSDGSDTFSSLNPSDGSDTFSSLNPSGGTRESEDSNPSGGNSESEDSNPLDDADDSAVYPEVTEPPIFNPPTGGFDPLPAGIPRTFATAGSGVFPGMVNPFFRPAGFAGFPFGGPRAFAGAGIPFINPGVPGYSLGFPFGVAGAQAYAGK